MNYTINEENARRSKEMSSHSDYKKGSATEEYQNQVAEAKEIAERQKKRVDPMYHEKIDQLLDTYCRKLAENMNKGFEIDMRCPSVLVCGPANFPTRKKEKQIAAWDKNMEEYNYIQGLLQKIKGVGTGGISSDDPDAIKKLELKLDQLTQSQEMMKAVNAYYRKHKTLDGCTAAPQEVIDSIKADMAQSWHWSDSPFAPYALSNNNATIRATKQRIEDLKKRSEKPLDGGWKFNGGEVVFNNELNRLQVIFDGKPDADIRSELKSNGFRWAPSQNAWQRQLTNNAIFTAKHYCKSIQPDSESK